MTPTTNLFELIKTLSKSDKRKFKLMLSEKAFSDKKNIALLFTYIQKQKEYNEAKLKEHFKHYTFINQLTSTKYYLYNQILKSLSRSAETKTVEGKIISILNCIPYISQNKLYQQSISLLEKAQKLAKDNELFVLLYEAYSIEEKTLYYLKNDENTLNRLKELLILKSDCLGKMQNQSLYQNHRTQLFAIIKKERFFNNSSSFIKLEKEFLNTAKNYPPLSANAIYNKHYCFGLIYFFRGQFQKSYLEYQSLLNYIEQKPILKTDTYKTNFLNAAQNCIVSATYIPLYDDFVQSLIAQLDTTYKGNEEYLLLILRLKLGLFIVNNKFDDAVKSIEKLAGLNTLLAKAEPHIYVDVVFSSMQAYLWAKNYKKAIKHLQLIINYKQDITPHYIYIVSRLIEILIHIELGNTDLIESLQRSCKRFLENEKEKYALEIAILNVIHVFDVNGDLQNKNSLYLELSKLTSKKSFSSEVSNMKLYFNFKKWLTQVNL